ncbi:alkane 1-monooxygenase [Psychromarinibacter sp. C21-152]|uniref:Alkane 1-monooxygenase n=1 Tax=Psychromarinibacter sediminicola TaxID=3033385 RepID=A0AAE3NMD5_9RHOB|nr:alkane 1-monooxygenase [Psychromarinibacter sediminicola]MDF0599983.1 alkane 1-monooxygenase [Psychromarinibacter sediminicola]
MPDRTATTTPGLAFTLASLAPVPLLAGAALCGTPFTWAALLYMTALAYLLDEIVAAAAPEGVEFPAHDRLSVVLAISHFALLILAVHALATPGLTVLERLMLFLGAGLFMGQVSNSNAHELIHRGDRRLSLLGKWVYISLLFGHHASAHPLVHHVHVATPGDPNSARLGESYWRFLPRAWIGSFRAGLAAETARSRRVGKRLNPYALYLTGAAFWLALSGAIAGLPGIAAHLALAAYAQAQLLLSDYVQHYGLTRAKRPDGRYEPVGPQHSWNAPHWLTSHMMLNAPRHSDHHAHPSRPYPELRLPSAQEAPILPRSLPAMATLALVPALWRRVMDRRVARWQPKGDAQYAAE